MRRAVFLDRDGTVIEDRHYLSDPQGVKLIDGAAQAIRLLSESGYMAVMVSNQSGVARGMFGEESVRLVNERVRELLAREGARLDAVYYCPHHPQGSVARYAVACDCRKPVPGMGLRAAREHGIDLKRSFMIGDKPDDVAFARACGMQNAYLVRTGHGAHARLDGGFGETAENILLAARAILREE